MTSLSLTRPGDAGMLPLYNMAAGFAEATIPDFILDYLEENGVENFLQDWNTWIMFLIGFLVCISVGLLYMLCMPLAGFSVCCCRTCCTFICKCCSGDSKGKPPPSKCKQRTCLIFLGIFTCFMFSAVVVNYVALSNLNHEFSPSGFLDDALNGLKDIERYAHDTGSQIEEVAVKNLENTADDVNEQLGGLVSGSMEALSTAASTEPEMTQLSDFIDNLPDLEDDLTTIIDTTNALNTLVSSLDTVLNTRRVSIESNLNNCLSFPDCQNAFDSLPNLRPVADYTNVDNVTTPRNTIRLALDPGGPIDVIQAEIGQFRGIINDIETEIGSEIEDMQAEIDSTVSDVTDAAQQPIDTLNGVSLEGPMSTVIDLKNPVHLYGQYAVYGLSFLTTICLLISVFFLIALGFGLIGSPATLKHGANLLLAGAGFTFIFGWLTMLVSVGTYASGAAAQGAACRYILDFGNTADRITAIGGDFINLPDILQNASIQVVIDSCRQNQSIYQTIEESGINDFNLSALLDFSQYGLSEALEEIKGLTITLPTVAIITDSTAALLISINDELKGINFTTYNIPLSEPNTKISIPDYNVLLMRAIDALHNVNDPLADDLREEVALLEEIEDTTIADLDGNRADLQIAVNDAETAINLYDMNEIVDGLNYSQLIINNEGEDIVSGFINNTVDSIGYSLESYANTTANALKYEVGNCRNVYTGLSRIAYAPCVYFLNPYQAVWFTYGWFLAMNIVSLAFVFQLADMFRVLGEHKKVNPMDTEGTAAATDTKPQPKPLPAPITPGTARDDSYTAAYPNTQKTSGRITPDSRVHPLPDDHGKFYTSDEHPW